MSAARVAIIGGGISGLACAYYLGKRGIRSVLIEKTDRLGGLIRTDVLEGSRLEAGPDSYIATKPAATELARELGGLGGEIISSNDAARRIFIVRAGKLVALPQGMSMMVPGRLRPALKSGLFGIETKARFVTERFARPRERAADFSVGELVADHFGEELLQYVADPLLAGVYGGAARSLSAPSVLPRFVEYERRFGSLIEGVRQEMAAPPKTGLFLSFRDGMQSLTDALSRAVSGHTQVIHEEALHVQPGAGGWEVELRGERLEAKDLVLACPAHVGGRLLERSAPELAAELGAIPYSSAILVTLVYESTRFSHPVDGFGFLVPQKERQAVAAATWINTKFPGRMAAGFTAIRAFLVAEEARRFMSASDAELTERVRRDLEQFMGAQEAPLHAIVYRWPQSMPQYVVGHKARVDRIFQLLLKQPGLQIIGNAYDGVGIPDCVRLAKAAAASVTS